MRVTRSLLANPTSLGRNNPLRPPPLALLPPLPLYRRVLRAHRKLPAEHRTLGDLYVKSEFKQHKSVENPIHIVGFLTEWQIYAQTLEQDAWKEAKIDKDKLDKMSDQQVGQLYELMQALQKRGEDTADDEMDEAMSTANNLVEEDSGEKS